MMSSYSSGSSRGLVDEAKFIFRLDNATPVPAATSSERCVVCTLPEGTCSHTKQWWYLRRKAREKTISKAKAAIIASSRWNDIKAATTEDDKEVHDFVADIMDVLSEQRVEYIRSPLQRKPPLSESSAASWSTIPTASPNYEEPEPRGGHSLCAIDATTLVLFGGVDAEKRKCFGGGHHSLTTSDGNPRWRKYINNENAPSPRYGHSAVVLERQRMLLFGGRGPEAKFFGDTYVLEKPNTWIRLQTSAPGPCARCFASMAACGSCCVLFGGRNALRCFDDVWVFERSTWTRPLVVGVPPLARYGHCVVPVDRGKILVLGGQTYEASGRDYVSDLKTECRLNALAARASSCAHRERTELYVPKMSGSTSSIDAARKAARRLAAEQSRVSAEAARREKDTTDAMDEAFAAAAAAAAAKRRNFGEIPLDTKLLDLDALTWRDGPGLARSLAFGNAASLGAGRAVVVGDGSQAYILHDLAWTKVVAKDTLAEFVPRHRAALEQLERNRQLRREVRDEARSLGIQKVDANLRVVAADATRVAIPLFVPNQSQEPRPRRGAATAAWGERVFVHGGWSVDERGFVRVLNLESPAEERRRLDKEFGDRLERSRRSRERDDRNLAEMAAERALRFLETCAARCAVEMCTMRFEEIRSACPPLTRAPDVCLDRASRATLWVSWKKVERDAKGRKTPITHVLEMRGGFRVLHKGDRVSVHCGDDTTRPARVKSERGRTYDVAFDDGGTEGAVSRGRIAHAEPGPWTIIYMGFESSYAVQGLVPEVVFETEPDVAVECEFRLRTKGAEFGWDGSTVVPSDDFSLPSARIGSYTTRPRHCCSSKPSEQSVFEGVGSGKQYV